VSLYLAAFTAATLNNQLMGFYQPFTITGDAQRHGFEYLCRLDGTKIELGMHVDNPSCQSPESGGRGQRPGRTEGLTRSHASVSACFA
jgi:error-prone DNA polymerase